ncbi:MAG TPA: DUF1800 domain-containing protein [Muricauda sp.]|uniref:DUF1800 domain-containing protein n=1 Tax=Flagellimonas aurea TaxID=2915619 RepID=A0ABS3G7Y6_9FLAO|nr:DUF1800 domain-containing protein [Allomuricauda aurea]MAO16207.1 hypothetical protein [Allomuricauda sp.]MBC73317.1 hypothetical protein [Allomuricauda sp.]MBO0355530.1 DUF1800 domain-containing protein [Allomuricauda aurea]HBU77960.1 DUF1800 domain-containing protein [Allomuricauda sp.]
MEYFINCNSSTLAPYTTPLDEVRAAHLYRRLGFSASVQTINDAVGQSAGALVDNLVNQALAAPTIPAPEWADWNDANYPADDDLARQMRNGQIEDFTTAYGNALVENELLDRMSFFWSNHFVTQLETYNCPGFLYYYINCLQRNALRNFKTLTSEVGLTSAMLYYLDGVRNRGDNPNENYARELYELFTLGEGNNYTEEDIIETSKALSGYTERGEEGCTAVTFDPTEFNTENKTIFGQTGNWDYDDVIDILFNQRPDEIGWFICKKLYEFFVHPDSTSDDGGIAPQIIDGLAQTFISSGFEIAPVLRQLFKSQHFFDETAIGVIIKSPADLYFNLLKETGFTYDDMTIINMIDSCALIGQRFFQPPEVEGWQRDRTWINTNFIIGRWLTVEFYLQRFYQNNPEQFRDLGLELSGNVGLTSNNPDEVAKPIIEKFVPKGLLTEADYQRAYLAFRSDVDVNYYEGGTTPSWTLLGWETGPSQVYLLLRHLSREPEFQLK